MTTTKNISKSSVMKSAWSLVKVHGMSMAVALKKAWAAFKAKALMQMHKVRIMYTKKDGSVREALATLNLKHYSYESKGSNRTPSYRTICYFDLEKNAFRSFCISSFIGVIGLAD